MADSPVKVDALRMAEEGLTISQIAEELDMTAHGVRVLLGRVVPAKKERTPLNDDVVQRIGARYLADDKIADICREEGVTVTDIYAILHELGIETRSGKNAALQQHAFAEACDMYERGATLDKITTATGMTAQTFYRKYRAAGGKIRNERKQRIFTPEVHTETRDR